MQTHLDQASQALAAGDRDAALAALLAAWRLRPLPRLAALIEALGAALISEPARQLQQLPRGEDHRAAWRALDDQGRLADRGALAACLVAPSRIDAMAFLERAARWGPDPRLAAELCAELRRPDLAYQDTKVGMAFWREALPCLAAQGDPRALEPLAAARMAPGAWAADAFAAARDAALKRLAGAAAHGTPEAEADVRGALLALEAQIDLPAADPFPPAPGELCAALLAGSPQAAGATAPPALREARALTFDRVDIRGVLLSGDGETVAVTLSARGSSTRTLQVRRLADGALRGTPASADKPFALSEDGAHLWTLQDAAIRCIDVATDRALLEVPLRERGAKYLWKGALYRLQGVAASLVLARGSVDPERGSNQDRCFLLRCDPATGASEILLQLTCFHSFSELRMERRGATLLCFLGHAVATYDLDQGRVLLAFSPHHEGPVWLDAAGETLWVHELNAIQRRDARSGWLLEERPAPSRDLGRGYDFHPEGGWREARLDARAVHYTRFLPEDGSIQRESLRLKPKDKIRLSVSEPLGADHIQIIPKTRDALAVRRLAGGPERAVPLSVGAMEGLAAREDGAIAAFAGKDVAVLGPEGGEIRWREEEESVSAAAWRGETLLLRTWKGIRRVRGGESELVFRLDGGRGLACSPGGAWVAASTLGSRHVLVLDRGFRVVRRLPCGQEAAAPLAFHPRRPVLAAAERDGSLSLWALPGGERLAYTAAGEPIRALAFHPDGARVIFLTQGALYQWAPAAEGAPRRLGEAAGLSALALHPGGQWAMIGDQHGQVRACDLRDGAWHESAARGCAQIHALAFCGGRLWVSSGLGGAAFAAWEAGDEG